MLLPEVPLQNFKTGTKNRHKPPLLPVSFHHLSAPLPWGEAKADSSRVREQGCGWGTFIFFCQAELLISFLEDRGMSFSLLT